MRIDLIGSQEKSLSIAINDQVSINCYAIASPKARSGLALVGSPGTALFCSVSGEMRGCVYGEDDDDVPFFVIGTNLVSVSDLGVSSSVGTIPGSGMVSMARDATIIIVVNGTDTGYFYDYTTDTFSSVSLPFIATTVALLDGYALFSAEAQKFFISNVNDVDTFDALDFAQANKSPDDIVAVIENHSEIFLFGTRTTEPWFDSGAVDFPFGQNTAGIIERGLYARFTVVSEDNTIFFLGDDLLVYRLEGYTPIRISDDSTDSIISNLFKAGYAADIRNAFAFFFADHGHKFYQITIPNRITLVYDIATRAWHQRKHESYETHHAVCYAKAYGKHLIGAIDGSIYEMSRSYYSDEDQVLRRVRRSNIYSSEDALLKWKSIKFIFEFGTTPLLEGQGSNPKIMLRWSDDGGFVFKNEKMLSLGEQGDYQAKAIKRNCGSSRARVIEFSFTDPSPFFLIDAFATIR